jgi:FtsH-binding integral membrane protein
VKQALQVAIILSVAVLLAASCGLALRLSGYFVAGAFGTLFRAPEDLAMRRELQLWMIYFGVSLGILIWLIVAYRRCKRTLWKSDDAASRDQTL